MHEPRHVVEAIRQGRENATDPVRFHWAVVDAEVDRHWFAEKVRELSGTTPVLAVVLRTAGFTHPNSVMNDLAAALEGARQDVNGGMRERIVDKGHVDVVLISREELAVPVTSSPVVLPSWFPIHADTEVKASILVSVAHLSLSAQEASVDDVRRLLYDLDVVLVDRVDAVGKTDDQNTQDLLDEIKRKSEPSLSLGDFVNGARAVFAGVRSSANYRPSSGGPTMIARLWRATAVKHSGDLAKLATMLVTALQVDPQDLGEHTESMVAVLARPSFPITDSVDRWAFDVIVTTGAACRLATAAAHADQYGLYPVHLLVSLSGDLRRALDGFVELLERLE